MQLSEFILQVTSYKIENMYMVSFKKINLTSKRMICKK